MKINFDRLCLIEFYILSVNCSHVCIIYVKIYEKISSGGLEVSQFYRYVYPHLICFAFFTLISIVFISIHEQTN